MFSTENNRLFGRRQYILGHSIITDLKNWNVLKICDDLFLTYHPDLNVDYIKTNSHMIVLLGIILDPFHPELSNKGIISNLSNLTSFEELAENTNNLGGRWIIIYHDIEQTKIFHDAAGNRQIFYSYFQEKTWCSSQPHHISKLLMINKTHDKEVMDFMDSELYDRSEHAWIGDGTFYDGIYHLLPNHFLDIKSGMSKRYWPHEKFRIENISVEQAVELSSHILQGMLKSISLRFPIALAVTAGWDTRVLLAASKDIKDEIYYFIQEASWNKGGSDIKVPNRLLKKLGLELHVENCMEKVIKDNEFNRFFYQNVAIIQAEENKVLHYNFYEKFQGKIWISGNVSEIARNYYGTDKNDLNAESLAQFFGRKGDKYTIRNINDWLHEVTKPAKMSNLNIHDLFYWEQRMGNWAAMFSADLDIAIEVIYPFNCRTLLITLLSVDKNYRLKKNPFLYRELIKKMWKETLSEPINPIYLQNVINYGARKIRNMSCSKFSL
jgi:asparagine synthetase B (glutamine-hydrolysing)